jgi:hypothetical protein
VARGRVSEIIETQPRGDQRFLDDILAERRLVEGAEGHRSGQRLVALHEFAKGLDLPGACCADELTVGSGDLRRSGVCGCVHGQR